MTHRSARRRSATRPARRHLGGGWPRPDGTVALFPLQSRAGSDRTMTRPEKKREHLEPEGVGFFRGLLLALALSVLGYAGIAAVILAVLALIR
jgi:hypothetical protein